MANRVLQTQCLRDSKMLLIMCGFHSIRESSWNHRTAELEGTLKPYCTPSLKSCVLLLTLKKSIPVSHLAYILQ